MRHSSRRKGQALVESALTVLLFLFMALGICDFGQFLYYQQALAERARAAARFAILDPSKTTQIRNLAVFNNTAPSESARPVIPSLSTSMVSVQSFNLGTPEGRVRVSISGYPINFLTPGLRKNLRARTVTVTLPSEAAW